MEKREDSNSGLNATAFFKPRILTTGPTPVPEFVLAAMAGSVHYHRGPAFAAIMEDCRKLLPAVFGTKEEVLIFSGTGTLAMEGAIANFFAPGDEVIGINGGKFGARWCEQARIYGCQVHEIKVERGHAVKVADVEAALKAHPQARGVLVHASETSTGVRNDVKAIAKLAKALPDCLTLVDGVTAVGVFDVPMDQWGVDVLVGGSQKGFMLPPGLSFGVASARAWARTEKIKNVRYYLDWRKERKAAQENAGAFTSAVTLVGGLQAVLRHFHQEGLQKIYARNWKMAYATRRAAETLGFELFVKDEFSYSAACTSLLAEGSYGKVLRERFGMTVSGGQDELKGKILRIGHLGYIDAWDVMSQLVAATRVAEGMGRKMNLAAGLETFVKIADSNENYTPKDLR
ncbi:MAG: alanine--glyoxylate aminotransferase family protein [Bdellovibrionales bacterium]|nr:alanine--glyoxylate aminotransferase family protein [Bdellovibrionales bacterium]